MIELVNLSVSLDALLPDRNGRLARDLAKASGMPESVFRGCEISRKSVDARKRSNVHFVVSVVLDDAALGTWLGESSRPDSASDLPDSESNLPDGGRCASAVSSAQLVELIGKVVPKGVTVREHAPALPVCAPDCSRAMLGGGFKRPVVIGAGPAGLFCALYLARAGLRPLVIERGCKVEERQRKVEAFFDSGKLDTECNVQFGEGGAGTFSDGKLTTGTKSTHIKSVLCEFVDAGAPPEILVDAKPHIGTDVLSDVVRNIRLEVESLGGEFMFNSRLDDVETDKGEVSLIRVADLASGRLLDMKPGALVLAIGHSARDTYEMLFRRGFEFERKPFAVGVRVEHLQSDIDRAQYGRAAGHPALGAADYKLATHNADGRGVYTFCMCPGGTVVAAASEVDGVCVNGMSVHARDGENANSALLVEVRPDDLEGNDPLEGMRLQRSLERAAFDVALVDGSEGAYKAPAQTIGGFMASGLGADSDALAPSSKVRPTYPRGVSWVDLHDCLPRWMASAIAEALPALDGKLSGFADPDAVMTAVEARSSAPVRILRDRASLQSLSCAGVYPAGEGAGYAGGIMSSAVDGIRCAEKIVEQVQSAPLASSSASKCYY